MSTIFATPEDAEDAFYEAIGRGDLDALMNVWAEDEEIICIHPTGQRLSGQRAIREGWKNIFSNNPQLTVSAQRNVKWKGVLIAVHSVIETLFIGDELTPHGPILSTNVYQRSAAGWHLLSHHASAAATDAETKPAHATHNTIQHTLH